MNMGCYRIGGWDKSTWVRVSVYMKLEKKKI